MIEPSKLFFLHIPKTGGMTLHAMLAKHFRPEKICPERHFEAALVPPSEVNRYDFFSAHTSYDLFLRLPKPARVVTLLRDPIERTISDYFFLRRFPGDAINPRIARELIPFERYLKWNNRFFQETLSNKHATFLCGHKHLNPKGRPWRSASEILDVGYERIESIDFVGITEYMDISIREMWQVLGFGNPGPILRVNAAAQSERQMLKVELTPWVLGYLEEINQLDLKLYNYAKRKFAERFQANVKASRRAANDTGGRWQGDREKKSRYPAAANSG